MKDTRHYCVKCRSQSREKFMVKISDTETKHEKIISTPMIGVWEVMYQWMNWEVSVAYPQHVYPENMKEGRSYYGNRAACQIACDKLNKHQKKSYFLPVN